MDVPVEPPACAMAFSVEADGLHYIWRGATLEEVVTNIGVYNVQTEQWALIPTTGPPPSGLLGGRCATVMNHLFAFGGSDGSTPFNHLHMLNLETFRWSKVYPRNHPSETPICKSSCGFLMVNERTLICFGGYGRNRSNIQPGSTFTRIRGCDGLTNEIHLFDIQKGIIYTNHHSVSLSIHVM